ncbi:hypothetical protein H310_03464 [Aphanomyces invadans]|uniref:Uncharacterized protein n=1 Tax=Aphanomyces invadans TaxID=157072 RepID=A0A024UHU2_9STRA|nr:hypothetical protein H310_03464 [Aphanomyces invadans]ETW05780.1 hypothetical protein H310_03464 [Aphanomyces invadans]|eukprot:XP_008865557.1 hypothetical protein H310_03464 [Aphanomyces invadans]
MKFLASLVHAAVASQVVFDSHSPPDKDGEFAIISRNRGAAVRFRSPSAADNACGPEGLTIDTVNFMMDTSKVAGDTSLLVNFCPSVNGKPYCTKSGQPARIPIKNIDKRAKFQWSPPSSIVLPTSSYYWFTIFSSAEADYQAPFWLAGTKEYSTVSDPNDDVITAFTVNKDGPWEVVNNRHLPENRVVGCLQVNTK